MSDNLDMSIQEYKSYVLNTTKEADFQKVLVQFARIMGWDVHWHPDEKQNAKSGRWDLMPPPGFPDLVMVRDERILFVELKGQRGKLSHDQEYWQEALVKLHWPSQGVVTYFCWKPENWDLIVSVLVKPGMLRGQHD